MFLILLGLAGSAWVTFRFEVPYPKPPGPQFDAKVKLTYQRAIEEKRPQLVLLGDSTLELGVDVPNLAETLNRNVYRIGIPGSASAVWYLALENNIASASYKPPYLVLFFRDTLLTRPDDRVTGRYFALVDELADRYEPLVTQLSYVQQMNPAERFLDQYLPLYGNKAQVKDDLEWQARYRPASLLLDCNQGCADIAFSAVFATENLLPEVARQSLIDVELGLYGPASEDFAYQVERSYLPEIIRLCRENGIQLILVRTRTLVYPTGQSEPAYLQKYIQDLSAYLASQGVTFLDFAHDPRLRPELFFDAVHMNDEGRVVFTQLLGEALQPILK
ncbi:MAG: hypothetical protein HY869_20805 [Chloroflexi bacterium]|nr:hypothetical protein [Chloroflexota bacterium]